MTFGIRTNEMLTRVMMRKNTITRIMNGTIVTGWHQSTAKSLDVTSLRIPGPDLVFSIYKKAMSSKYWWQLFLPTLNAASSTTWGKLGILGEIFPNTSKSPPLSRALRAHAAGKAGRNLKRTKFCLLMPGRRISILTPNWSENEIKTHSTILIPEGSISLAISCRQTLVI